MFIRDVLPTDAAQIIEIYAPVVRDTAITFELQPPSPDDMRQRIARASAQWPWIVMAEDEQLCGYAYAVPFRSREAYARSAETTVYVHERYRGQGVGQRLMVELLQRLRAADHHVAIAGVALPNPASVALHERLGFQHVGIFPQVGRKFDQWHDVGFWSLQLDDAG